MRVLTLRQASITAAEGRSRLFGLSQKSREQVHGATCAPDCKMSPPRSRTMTWGIASLLCASWAIAQALAGVQDLPPPDRHERLVCPASVPTLFFVRKRTDTAMPDERVHVPVQHW